MRITNLTIAAAGAALALSACGGGDGGQSQASAEFFQALADAPSCESLDLSPGQPAPLDGCYDEAAEVIRTGAWMGFDCESGSEIKIGIEDRFRWVAVDGVIVDASIDPVSYTMGDIEEACQS